MSCNDGMNSSLLVSVLAIASASQLTVTTCNYTCNYRYLDDNLLTEIDDNYFSEGLEQLTLL